MKDLIILVLCILSLISFSIGIFEFWNNHTLQAIYWSLSAIFLCLLAG